ncbi:MAG: site-specific integrase [Verrucomicrobiota bacterium JB022]|nr:site-specific integrase [Verrucomicrobiota bacterium JB022]
MLAAQMDLVANGSRPVARIINLGDRAKPWRVTYKDAGKRKTQHFAYKLEAEEFVAALEKERQMAGIGLALPAQERTNWQRIKRAAEAAGLPLDRAVDLAVAAIATAQRTTVTVEHAYDRWLVDCERRNLRPKTLASYQSHVLPWKRGHHEEMVDTIDLPALWAHLERTYQSPSGYRSAVGSFSAFLNFAATQGWREPVKAQKGTVRQDEHTIAALRWDEARDLIDGAPPHYRAALALALFVGLRPEGELQRITWDAVDWEMRVIRISGKMSKVREKRELTDLPSSVWAWLDAYAPNPARGKIAPVDTQQWYRTLTSVRESRGIQTWGHDIMRHSFASHAYNLGYEWAMSVTGHETQPRTFVRHYKQSRTRMESAMYFSIFPDGVYSPLEVPDRCRPALRI